MAARSFVSKSGAVFSADDLIELPFDATNIQKALRSVTTAQNKLELAVRDAMKHALDLKSLNALMKAADVSVLYLDTLVDDSTDSSTATVIAGEAKKKRDQQKRSSGK